MTSHVNVALIRKLPRSVVCFAYSFDMLFKDVCTKRQRQIPGRLVQELNVCTVHV